MTGVQRMTGSPQLARDSGLPVNDVIENAVIRVIEAMRQNLSEPLTIDDLAAAAMFSKFHFTRIFQRVTGVSPGRFLSALRLQEAKRLLLSTSLSVTEITHRVGYSSVGTFSTRFKESVGLAPSEFRRMGGFTTVIATDNRPRYARSSSSTTLLGNILPPSIHSPMGMVFVGLFPDWIPEGQPVKCTVLRRPGPYLLENIPPGTWHLLAHAVAPGKERISGASAQDQSLVVGAHGPIPIRSEMGVTRADLQLRPMRTIDPPVLIALLDIRNEALSRQSD
jgi:AraC-like DNA-binding protein